MVQFSSISVSLVLLLLLACTSVALAVAQHSTVVRVRPSGLVTCVTGGTMRLDCVINVTAGLVSDQREIEWRVSDNVLLESDRHRRILSNGSLLINHAYTVDSVEVVQVYRCAVKLKQDVYMISDSAHLYLVPSGTRPIFSHHPRSLVVRPGELAMFRCVVDLHPRSLRQLYEHQNSDAIPSYLHYDSLPRVSITWYRYEHQLSEQSGRTTIHHSRDGASVLSVLHVHNVVQDDYAYYKCRAEIDWASRGGPNSDRGVDWASVRDSKVDRGVAYSEFARLSPDDDRPHIEAAAPKMILEPLNKHSRYGDSITLYCAAVGKDRKGAQPQVTWLRNGVTIDQSGDEGGSKYRLVGGTHLHIESLSQHDGGAYTCRATNSEDSTDGSAYVDVLVPPTITHSSDNEVVSLGGEFEARCLAYGEPMPTIRWYKNGQEMTISQPSDGRSISQSNSLHSVDGVESEVNNDYIQSLDGGTRLKILGVMTSDQGVYQCIATNEAGTSQSVTKLNVVNQGHLSHSSDLISPPSDPVIVDLTSHSVTIAWKFSQQSSAQGDQQQMFCVRCIKKGSDRERVFNISQTELVIDALHESVVYLVKIHTMDTEGRLSLQSVGIEVKTRENDLPPAPRIMKAEATGSTSIKLSWRDFQTAHSERISYGIYYYKLGDVSSEREIEVEGATDQVMNDHEKSHVLNDLEIYQAYVISVRSSAGERARRYSREIICTTLSDVPSQPPGNITAEAVGSKNIIIRWEEPVYGSANGMITGYKLRYRRAGDRGGAMLTTDASRRMIELQDLERSMEYSVRMAVLNINGTGPYSAWISAETLYNDLDESVVPGQPKALRARPMTSSIALSWLAPDNHNTVTIRGYILGYGVGIPDVYRQILDAKHQQHTIKGLKPNSEYVISVRAFNNAGEGEPKYDTVFTRLDSDESTIQLLPPVGLRAVIMSATSVHVHWSDSTLDAQPRRMMDTSRLYTVRYSPNLSSAHRPRYINVTSLSARVDDLEPNTEYEFSVRLVHHGKQSAWSLSVFNRTSQTLPITAPLDLMVDQVQGRSGWTSVTWQPPRQSNGPVTGYLISYTRDASLPDSDWLVEGVPGDRVSTVVRYLTPQTTYFFKISARNAMGYGPFSPTVIYRTPDGSGFGGGMLSEFDRIQGYSGVFSTSNNDRGRSEGGRENTAGYTGVPEFVLWAIIGCVSIICVVAIVTGVVCYRRHNNKNNETQNSSTGRDDVKCDSGSQVDDPGARCSGLKPPDLWIHDQQVRRACSSSASSNRSSSIPGSAAAATLDDASTLNRTIAATDILDDARYGRRPLDRSLMIPIDQPMQSREPLSSLIPMSGLMCSSTGGIMSVGGSDLPYSPSGTTLPYRPLYSRPGLPQVAPYQLAGGPIMGANLYTTAPRVNASNVLDCDLTHNAALAADQAFSTLERHRTKSESSRRNLTTQRATVRPTQLQGSSGQGHSSTSKSTSSSRSHLSTTLMSSNSTEGLDTTHDASSQIHKSVSTEELTAEMVNLEGLMKDLNSITRHEFNC